MSCCHMNAEARVVIFLSSTDGPGLSRHRCPLGRATTALLSVNFSAMCSPYGSYWYGTEDGIAAKLNTHPRKTLAFKTPAEMLEAVLH